MGFIEAICISKKKGTVKKSVLKSELIENWGLKSDAHGGDWHRQVSLLSAESIDEVKKAIPALVPGAFAENLVVRGIDLRKIKIGDKLKIGNSPILEITQIGKECHTSCVIKTLTGDCIMPREGLFARVLKGGVIKTGDKVIKMESTQN
jgi:MOSC domain-containing protein YiiM